MWARSVEAARADGIRAVVPDGETIPFVDVTAAMQIGERSSQSAHRADPLRRRHRGTHARRTGQRAAAPGHPAAGGARRRPGPRRPAHRRRQPRARPCLPHQRGGGDRRGGPPMTVASFASPEEAETIARQAIVFAYPMLFNYKTLWEQTQDQLSSAYTGGFNRYRPYTRS